jgi:alkylation response protein AidB-like acyl-CoA dehydrogenase
LEAGCSLGAMPVYRFGTEEQKQEWLPLLCSGQALGAFGLTEPGAGSDAGGTRTTAVLADGQWTINGSKAFITNSGTDITRLVTVTAVTGRRPDGGKEISSILVPVPTAGFTAEPAYDKVGWHASDTTRSPSTTSGSRGEPARRARARLRELPPHPRRGPHRHRRALCRSRAGLRRREHPVRR